MCLGNWNMFGLIKFNQNWHEFPVVWWTSIKCTFVMHSANALKFNNMHVHSSWFWMERMPEWMNFEQWWYINRYSDKASQNRLFFFQISNEISYLVILNVETKSHASNDIWTFFFFKFSFEWIIFKFLHTHICTCFTSLSVPITYFSKN